MIKLLDLHQAAERLGVNYSTAQEWAVRGILPAFKLPGRRKWSIDPGDLERFIEAQKAGPNAGPQSRSKSPKTGPNRAGQLKVIDGKGKWMEKYA